jgi:hypothetical protein
MQGTETEGNEDSDSSSFRETDIQFACDTKRKNVALSTSSSFSPASELRTAHIDRSPEGKQIH